MDWVLLRTISASRMRRPWKLQSYVSVDYVSIYDIAYHVIRSSISHFILSFFASVAPKIFTIHHSR